MRGDLPIVILAGGASSRMAPRDKLLEEVEGVPLLRLQAMRALKVSPAVHVLLRPGWPARQAALQGLDVTIFEPDGALEGMGGSLRAAVQHMGKARAFVLLLADLVEITARDIATVIDAAKAQPGALICRGATVAGDPGHPMLIRQEAYPLFAKLKDDEGGRRAIMALGDQARLVPLPGTRARRDLNTIEDWAEWRAQQRAFDPSE